MSLNMRNVLQLLRLLVKGLRHIILASPDSFEFYQSLFDMLALHLKRVEGSLHLMTKIFALLWDKISLLNTITKILKVLVNLCLQLCQRMLLSLLGHDLVEASDDQQSILNDEMVWILLFYQLFYRIKFFLGLNMSNGIEVRFFFKSQFFFQTFSKLIKVCFINKPTRMIVYWKFQVHDLSMHLRCCID